MKVGIVLFQNMRHAPFLNYYENILKATDDLTYDIIYVDRHPELNEANDEHHIAVPWIEPKGILRAPGKIKSCLGFGVRVKQIIQQNRYDMLILLTTVPAVLLSSYLFKAYKKRYIIDIRDFTYEKYYVYRNIEAKLTAHSLLNVISSPAFVSFLPKADYSVLHNFNTPSEDHYTFVKKINSPIVISYVGIVQYSEQCKRMIDLVCKDERFELRFYGMEGGTQEVFNAAKATGNSRIKVIGAFTSGEKEQIYLDSDLIFNCYGNDSVLLKCAISNKHYDGALYKKPLLVSPDTVMADLAGTYAYALDLEHATDLNDLMSWYQSLDPGVYQKYARNVISTSRQENEQTLGLITNVINNLQMEGSQ